MEKVKLEGTHKEEIWKYLKRKDILFSQKTIDEDTFIPIGIFEVDEVKYEVSLEDITDSILLDNMDLVDIYKLS